MSLNMTIGQSVHFSRMRMGIIVHAGGDAFCCVVMSSGCWWHRLQSLCENSQLNRPAAKAAFIMHTLRHG